MTLIRYVEQNPLRAKLVRHAEDWQWSSLWRREKGSEKDKKLLDPLPIELPTDYLASVNEVLPSERLTDIRYSVNKGKPYGTLGEACGRTVWPHSHAARCRETER